MFERFTRSARMAVKAAISEAERRNDSHIGTEHLLLGVAAVSSASIRRVVDLSVTKLRAGLDSLDESALSSVGIDMGAVEGMSYDLSFAGQRHRLFTGGGKQVSRDASGSLSMPAIGGLVPNTSCSPSADDPLTMCRIGF